jgi:hypothetical protein
MSDQSFNNDAGLSKLRSHLDTEQYGAGTVSQYMAVARRYLQQAPWMYPLRHEYCVALTRPVVSWIGWERVPPERNCPV